VKGLKLQLGFELTKLKGCDYSTNPFGIGFTVFDFLHNRTPMERISLRRSKNVQYSPQESSDNAQCSNSTPWTYTCIRDKEMRIEN
jgi:hypothetical protein